jgi:hypothetical protein
MTIIQCFECPLGYRTKRGIHCELDNSSHEPLEICSYPNGVERRRIKLNELYERDSVKQEDSHS